MSYQDEIQERIEKLSPGPNDLLIVRTEADMQTMIGMSHQGIGFSKYANPVLFIEGVLEKATEEDLLDALRVIREFKKSVKEENQPVVKVN